MRRAHQKDNDAKGYDTIVLPHGARHRVFTKEQYRIGRDGSVLPPPERNKRRGGGSGSGGGGGKRKGGKGKK